MAKAQKIKRERVNSSDSLPLRDNAPKRVDVQVTRVFSETIESDARVVVNRGGAGSGKSYSTMQTFIYKMLTERGKKFLIIRKSLPSLRQSTLYDFRRIVDQFGIRDRLTEEKVMLNFIYKNNYLHFGSVDNVEKYKSTDWNYIWLEEATEFSFNEFMVLKSRLRSVTDKKTRNRMYLSFNPVDETHWIKEKVVDVMSDCQEIHSTYKDNPFLNDDYIADIEDLINQDVNFYRVYGLGEWGRLGHLIYNNWDVVDYMPTLGGEVIYGIDFGYNVPSVLLKLVIIGQHVYEQELVYETGLTLSDFAREIKRAIPVSLRSKPIYADSAEPASIKELKQHGLMVRPASKRVNEGISFVKTLHIHVHSGSTNVLKEKKAYSWMTDKAGRSIDTPIKFLDHAQDAERYAIYTHLKSVGEYRVRWL